MSIRRILVAVVMLTICNINILAQTAQGYLGAWSGKESKEEVIRRQIDIDMSVPDFQIFSTDQNVMGWKLAKMIDAIQKNYKQNTYNRMISQIRYELTEDPRIRFADTDKLTFLKAEKSDSIILISWRTFSRLSKKEKVEHDITFKFVNGVSDTDGVNNLFTDISRYVRPDEEE